MRLKSLVFALALALVPAAGHAQTAQPVAAPAQPEVTPPPAAEVSNPNAAERITTPLPQLPTSGSRAPEAPDEATGLGSASPALPDPQPTVGGVRTAPTPGIGQPVQAGMDLQPTVTALGDEGRRMNNNLLLPIMAAITVFVFALLFWAMTRYRRKDGVEPSKVSHNTLIEVIWTAVPVVILLIIAIPSFQLLANQYDPPKPDVTIKAIGHQWYWEYQYPDHGDFSFDSVMLSDADSAKQGVPRLLDVDNRMVVPAGATVKVLVTAADVGHAFAVPAFWVKMDAWPGRVNETWFKTDRPGVYYGQCSELCGTKHAFMPIAVEVLPREQFAAWVRAKQAEEGITPTAAVPATSVGAAPVAPAAADASTVPAAVTPPTAAAETGVSVPVSPVEPAATQRAGADSGRNAGTNADTN